MKVAVAGKGGVGKTTVAALLAHVFAEQGAPVIAIDADPVSNLAAALGFPKELAGAIVPVGDMADLIEERTGSRPGEPGAFFRLNPRVDDLPDRLSAAHSGIRLLRLGSVTHGGQGCLCASHALLRALVNHLVLARGERIVMDMEAGLEHLGRATARGVDAFLIVVEPGRQSLSAAAALCSLAGEIGLSRLFLVGNKMRGPADRAFVAGSAPPGIEVLGYLSADPGVVEADMKGLGVHETCPGLLAEARLLARALESAAPGAADAGAARHVQPRRVP